MTENADRAKSFAAALMAGGKSLRMGQDKTCLTAPGGREFWRRGTALLDSLHPDERLISCRPGQRFPAAGGWRVVPDVWPDAGPLSGIVSCLEAMATGRLLVLAVDMPDMTAEVLRRLLEVPGGAIFEHGPGRLEPLAAVYPASMAAEGRRRLEAGSFSLHGWISSAGEAMKILPLPGSSKDCFRNLNHPAEFGEWRIRQRGAGHRS